MCTLHVCLFSGKKTYANASMDAYESTYSVYIYIVYAVRFMFGKHEHAGLAKFSESCPWFFLFLSP